MNHATFVRAACASASALLIAGCGGGSDPTENNAPAADGAEGSVILTQPASATVYTGDTATFSVTTTGAALGFQWQKNGVAIAGATSASFTTPSVTYADSGAQYTVIVSSAGGSVTSSPATLALKLSTNQQAFEDLILAPSGASYELRWNLNYQGAQVSGTNYAQSDFSVVATSPLTHGPQRSAQSAPRNLASSLALHAGTPTRILKDGAVLVVPAAQTTHVASYTGREVRIDTLASDGTTVAYSQQRSEFVTVPLSGLVVSAPADLAHWHNSFWSNAAILDPAASFGPGAAYLKFTATNKGDRYTVFDCTATTTDANVTPCVSGSTLEAALTAGMVSNSDGKTYHLADGTVSTVGGVPVWVATTPRPVSATLSSTVQYRIYFQRNGNVYTGALTKDGQVLGGSYWVSNPAGATVEERLTFLPFQIRLNKAAHDGIAAALKI